MDAMVICAALLAPAAIGGLAWRRRSRSDQRLQWLGTSERDWTSDELDALRSADVTV